MIGTASGVTMGLHTCRGYQVDGSVEGASERDDIENSEVAKGWY